MKKKSGNKQGERSVNVVASVKPALRDLLVLAADRQFRSVSGQAVKYIVDGLTRDGFISLGDQAAVTP